MKTYVFPGRYGSLERISHVIVEAATTAGFNDKDIYAIQTAVDEACSNIIDHAYGGQDLGDIEMQVSSSHNNITIVLHDQGHPFTPDSVPHPDLTSDLLSRKERGLGLYFMRKLMDEVRFEFSSEGGNTLTLIKYKDKKA